METYVCCEWGKSKKFTEPERLKGTKHVSVILPTYNEEELIERLVSHLRKALEGYDYEIVIVDDNSEDRTGEIIDTNSKEGDLVAVHRYGKKGILSAILDGIKFSRGSVIVLMDADFSHPPEKVPMLLKYIQDYDFVSASRFIKGSDIIAPLSRKSATILLNSVLRIILGLKPHDLTGVFHAIRRDKLGKLRLKYPAVWGEFDMELFFLAVRARLRIKEIPFTYDFRKEGVSKSENLFKYGWIYLSRAITIRLFR